MRGNAPTSRLGAALLLALFMIVLLGSLAVLWLSGLRTLRRVESASHAQRRAGALEQFALDQTLTALREAARDGAPERPYLPATPRQARPPRILPPLLADDPGLRRLLQVSSGTVNLAAGKRPLPTPDLGTPRLHTIGGGPAAGEVFWIYLGQDGPLSEAAARDRPSQVIGRYAFTLWDIGGALDVNHLAHPEIPATSGAAQADLATWLGRRGSMRALEAASLPGAGPGLAALIAWREPVIGQANGAFGSVAPAVARDLASYRQFTDQFLPRAGSEVALEGTQRFFSRKDFLKVATALAPDLPVAEFTPFTRGLAEPAARLDRQVKPQLSLAGAPVVSERLLTTGDSLNANTPVLARRFPLERLELLGYAFPDGSTDDLARQKELRRWFGLYRASNADAWTYVGSRADGSLAANAKLATLEEIAAEEPAREPNFFETLKAAILPMSLGQNLPGAAAQGSAELQKDADLHLLQIGLNVIDQWDADSFPTVLEAFPPGWTGLPIRLAGIENLPYLSQLHLDALNPFWWWEGAVPYADRRLIPYLIPELWMPHQAALSVPPASADWNSTSAPTAGPRAVRLRLEGSVKLSMLDSARPPVQTRFNTVSGVLVIASTDFSSYGPVPRPVLKAEVKDGCWDNGDFTYRGQALGEPSTDGRLPNTSFYAARLTPNPTSKELMTAAFDVRPLNPNYVDVSKESDAGYPQLAQPPYPGMAKKVVKGEKVWAFNDADSASVVVEMGAPPERFDVVMDYLDHAGRWVPYTSFAAGSPNQAATNGLGNSKAKVEALLMSGRMLSNLHHTVNQRRIYLDAGGAVTLFKGDPRTARMGVALANSHVTGKPFLNGMAGLLPRSPMRWAGVLDLEGEGVPLDASDSVSTPNSFGIGAGGFFGRGLMNRHVDNDLGAAAPMKFTKFSAGDRLARPAFGSLKYADFFPGLFGENIDFADPRESHYQDADGVVRPGDGWMWRHAVDAAHGVGPGQAGDEQWLRERSANQLYTNQATFPRLLNRPFQSVAELGHVFRDLPQRSLDFTSPVSADAALLDAFCLRETPLNRQGRSVVGGTVNPGALSEAALAGLLAGTEQAAPQLAYSFKESPYLDQQESNLRDDRTSTMLPGIMMSQDNAQILALNLETRLAQAPAESAVDLVATLADNDADAETAATPAQRPLAEGASSVRAVTEADTFPRLSAGKSTAYPAVKSERESPLRALSEVAEFRVWNVFLDSIVESGSVPRTAAAGAELEEFTPRARRRAWYHIAIDRVTGEVLEVQRERAEF